MEYSPPQIFRSIQVTDSLKLANTDVLPTLLGLQTGLGNLGTTDITLKNVTCTSLASSGTVSCGVSPTALGHLTPKAYVDGISYLQVGNGLTKTFSTLSVNASQPQITSLGTLSNLALTGNISSNVNAAVSGTTYSALFLQAGGYGCILSGGITQGVGSVAKLEMKNGASVTPIVTFDGSGNASFPNPVIVGTCTLSTHAATKGYSDTALALKADKTYVDALSYLTIGSGLSKVGSTLSLNAAQITSVGTLSSLAVSGSVTSSSFQVNTGSLSSSGGGLFLLGAGASNYLSLKPYNAGAVEFLMTGSVTILKRSDGATSLYVDNVTGGITIDNAFGISATGTIQGLNQFKFSQLANINTTVISSTQWAYLGAMNQNIHTTSSPTFAAVTSGTLSVSNATRLATNSNALTSSSGALNVNGDIHLYNGTNPSQVTFATAAFGPPTTTNRSIGSRLVVYPGVTATTADWAIGIEQNNMWFSTSSTTTGFSWYGGATLAASLSGAGALALTGGLSATSGNFTGNVASIAPSAGSHLCNKTYVDNAITTANASVSTGTFTTGTFSISGLTFIGLSKTVRWSKVGMACIVSAEFTWSSTTGVLTEADGNTTISTPFNSPIVRSMNVVIQKDSFVTTKMSYMDEASPALKTRVNAADMPGYATGATLLFSWTFYT